MTFNSIGIYFYFLPNEQKSLKLGGNYENIFVYCKLNFKLFLHKSTVNPNAT